MTIEIPDTSFTEAAIKLEIALALFEKEVFTLAQAARLADMHRMAFQEELAKRKIPIHYDITELEEDMKTLGVSF